MDFIIAIAILLLASRGAHAIDVLKYGAIGDGRTDDSHALLEAWADVCWGTPFDPTLYIPAGRTFLLKPIKFFGPCKSRSVTVQVMGDIVAPNNINAWTGHNLESWLVFENVNGLSFEGRGTIDGQGEIWWQQANKLKQRPIALSFNNCNNLNISGMTSINSQGAHISINGCHDVTVANLRIFAPDSSPNTDGIDIGHSRGVLIRDTIIGTGDDCIAIGGGTSFVNINRVTCGPGHGISIGSLGQNGDRSTVEEVDVSDCTFKGSTNGLRIKTWQGGSGYARKISYERITLEETANPIIIDQFYCPWQKCLNKTSAVKVSDVTYNGVSGTSSTDQAIILHCSQSVGCTNIELININIESAIPSKATSASCLNAHGRSGPAVPTVHCLLP